MSYRVASEACRAPWLCQRQTFRPLELRERTLEETLVVPVELRVDPLYRGLDLPHVAALLPRTKENLA